MSNGREVKHAVCAASQSHIHCQSIFKCFLCHKIRWPDPILHQLHNLHACSLCQPDPLRVNSRYRSISRQPYTQHFGQTVHAVCCKHPGTGTTGGACLLFIYPKFLSCDLTCLMSAHCFRYSGIADPLFIHGPCQHRTAAYKDGRNIKPCRRH